MDGRQFDAIVRSALGPSGSRRGLLRVLGIGAAVLGVGSLLDPDNAAASQRRKKRRQRRRGRRKRRQRIERRKVLMCHDEQLIKVRRRAVERHLQHGDRLESCDVLQGVQTCENAKLPCNTDPTVCNEQDGCFCYTTTTGGSICATDGVECKPGTTCVVDSDCGDGFACVPMFGCDDPPCSDTGNACAEKCIP